MVLSVPLSPSGADRMKPASEPLGAERSPITNPRTQNLLVTKPSHVGEEASLLALSVKQPWAALLVSGLKTVEVRRWRTEVRGRVLIHAARIPDDRPEGWARLTDEARPLAEMRGGVIGEGSLAECKRYNDGDEFMGEGELHFNAAEWYDPPMYGFRFAEVRAVPLFVVSGNIKFFAVEGYPGQELVEPPEREGRPA